MKKQFFALLLHFSVLLFFFYGEHSPLVYFTREITAESLVQIYNALGWKAEGRVAVKLSTGEPPASNYLRPELIADLVRQVNGTIVECNTVYGGSRTQTKMHYQVAKDHGFTEIAAVDIQDADGSFTLPVANGKVLSENYVGASFPEYDSYLVLSHFKGHIMAGFGGAIKNISIGLASSKGKSWIHSGGKSVTNPWGGNQTAFTESMAEAGKSVSDYLGHGKRIVYINVMNRLSVDCDCAGLSAAEPTIPDIGMVASTDILAIDQACVDLVYSLGKDKNHDLVERIETRHGLRQLSYMHELGMGKDNYELVDIDL